MDDYSPCTVHTRGVMTKSCNMIFYVLFCNFMFYEDQSLPTDRRSLTTKEPLLSFIVHLSMWSLSSTFSRVTLNNLLVVLNTFRFFHFKPSDDLTLTTPWPSSKDYFLASLCGCQSVKIILLNIKINISTGVMSVLRSDCVPWRTFKTSS